MQLDLKNVRVTYTLKEVVLAVGTIVGLATHVVRTELQHASDVEQISKLTSSVQECKDKLKEYTQRAER